jgi:hypothetical protein
MNFSDICNFTNLTSASCAGTKHWVLLEVWILCNPERLEQAKSFLVRNVTFSFLTDSYDSNIVLSYSEDSLPVSSSLFPWWRVGVGEGRGECNRVWFWVLVCAQLWVQQLSKLVCTELSLSTRWVPPFFSPEMGHRAWIQRIAWESQHLLVWSVLPR